MVGRIQRIRLTQAKEVGKMYDYGACCICGKPGDRFVLSSLRNRIFCDSHQEIADKEMISWEEATILEGVEANMLGLQYCAPSGNVPPHLLVEAIKLYYKACKTMRMSIDSWIDEKREEEKDE